MRSIISSLVYLFLLFQFSGPCDEETVEPEANIVLDGSIGKGSTQDGLPTVKGYVKNIGLGTGYKCRIIISAHVGWNNKIVSATDISLNDGNPIAPGARVSFEGILPNLHSHYEYDFLTYELHWVRRSQISSG